MHNIKELKKIFNNKKVFMTGHTGFKGSYMCVLLKYLGAKVYGYSLKPEKDGLYELLTSGVKYSVGGDFNVSCLSQKGLETFMHSSVARMCTGTAINRQHNDKLVEDEVFADIRDEKKLTAYMKKVKPDFVIHMAAQPLVLLGYEEPHYTYDVNVMGTVNLMEAIRKTFTANTKYIAGASTTSSQPISILNVTTDKVYENNDLSNYAFKENDKLCGRDPYANSKSCSELVTYSYEKSFFSDKNIYRISTARAGNVIGGGDLNKDRIIPDCYRAIKNKKEMFVRNPLSVRPYQYVLEPLLIYLNILAYQLKNKKYEGHYNIGPDKKACLNTKNLVTKFYDAVETIGKANDKSNIPNVVYNKIKSKDAKHEAAFLRLDNNLIKKQFQYKEIFNMDKTMMYTAKIYLDMLHKENIYKSIYTIIEELR